MKWKLDYFTNGEINEVFILFKRRESFLRLIDIVSEPILGEFERRVRCSY